MRRPLGICVGLALLVSEGLVLLLPRHARGVARIVVHGTPPFRGGRLRRSYRIPPTSQPWPLRMRGPAPRDVAGQVSQPRATAAPAARTSGFGPTSRKLGFALRSGAQEMAGMVS